MEHIAALEERMVTDRLRRKLEEVNTAAKNQLAPIQDHVNFTLQKAYFRCAYECFDRRRKQEEVNDCVEHCSVPVLNANNLVETEMAKFQERLNRSLMVCQDKFESAKLQQMKSSAMTDLESCVDQAIQDNIRVLPHLVDRLKATLSMGQSLAGLDLLHCYIKALDILFQSEITVPDFCDYSYTSAPSKFFSRLNTVLG